MLPGVFCLRMRFSVFYEASRKVMELHRFLVKDILSIWLLRRARIFSLLLRVPGTNLCLYIFFIKQLNYDHTAVKIIDILWTGSRRLYLYLCFSVFLSPSPPPQSLDPLLRSLPPLPSPVAPSNKYILR